MAKKGPKEINIGSLPCRSCGSWVLDPCLTNSDENHVDPLDDNEPTILGRADADRNLDVLEFFLCIFSAHQQVGSVARAPSLPMYEVRCGETNQTEDRTRI